MVGAATRGRTRQSADRRAEILAAAVHLFAKTGYRNTEVQLIADTVGIAKGTVYLYYKTKKALFLAVVSHAIERLAERIDAEVETAMGPIDKIKAIVRAYFRFFAKDSALVEILARERADAMHEAGDAYYRMLSENAWRLESILQEGMAQGVFRPLEAKQTALLLSNLLTGTAYAYVLGNHQGRTLNTAPAVTDFVLHAIIVEEKR